MQKAEEEKGFSQLEWFDYYSYQTLTDEALLPQLTSSVDEFSPPSSPALSVALQ